DKIVSPVESKSMTAALTKAGGRPLETEFPAMGHDVWKTAYDQDSLYAWMLDPQKYRGSIPPVTQPAVGQVVHPEFDLPFVPALDVPNAVHVRLGNEMFATLAESIPSTVTRD